MDTQLKRKGIKSFHIYIAISLRSPHDKYSLILQSIKGKIRRSHLPRNSQQMGRKFIEILQDIKKKCSYFS